MRSSFFKKLMPLGSLILGGCDYTPLSSSSTGAADTSPLVPPLRIEKRFARTGSLFGELSLSSGEKELTIPPALWYGSLKTLESFPLDISDQSKGTLQTQWITLTSHPKERFQIRITLVPCPSPCLEAVTVSVVHQNYCDHTWQLGKSPVALVYKIKESLLLNTRYYQSRLMTSSSKSGFN
jgi:hypothetical protein